MTLLAALDAALDKTGRVERRFQGALHTARRFRSETGFSIGTFMQGGAGASNLSADKGMFSTGSQKRPWWMESLRNSGAGVNAIGGMSSSESPAYVGTRRRGAPRLTRR